MFRMVLFGIPRLYLGTTDLSKIITGRSLALLVYLAVTGKAQDRNILADLLWNNLSETQAKKNLRYVLYDLRRAIGDYLLVSRQSIAFNHKGHYWLDTEVFASYLQTETPKTNIELYKEVLALYQGDCLDGFYIQDAPIFEKWLTACRHRLHTQAIKGFHLLTQEYVARREYHLGLQITQRLLTLEPWNEEAHRQQMRLLAYSDQRSAAMQQYIHCCQILAEELDAAPMPQTTTIYNAIKADHWFTEDKRQQEHPSPGITDAHPAPQPLTAIAPSQAATRQFDLGAMPKSAHFYGRQAELATLQSLIGQEQSRLVALLGVSGQGKTTLAAAFVQDMIEDEQRLGYTFTSVIWRSLQNAPTCIEILQGWLQTLEATPYSSPLPTAFDELVTRLFTILETRRCLLVLDSVDALRQSCKPENAAAWKVAYPDDEVYTQLFRLFYERRHRSCLLLTSRYRPSGLSLLEERNRAFHCLTVHGLSLADSTTLLKSYRINSDSTFYQLLYGQYAGNPLLLNQAANFIHECFAGNVYAFVAHGMYFLGDIGMALAQQMSNLSDLEQQILCLLAQAKQPLTWQALWLKLPLRPRKRCYFEALQHLRRGSLLEWTDESVNITVPLHTYLVEVQADLVDKTRIKYDRP